MFKRCLMLCGLLVLVLFTGSCLLDPKEGDPPIDPPARIERKDLTQKWHVLNNIEYAYQERDKDAYDELVGENFTFFFAPGDVGGNIPEQWGRVDEVDATERLFASNNQSGNPPPDPVCRSIRLDLNYNKDTMQWVEQIPEGFPDEVWYYATVFYSFTFEVEPDITYIPVNGARAEFGVRNVLRDGKDHWELVSFRDLGGT